VIVAVGVGVAVAFVTIAAYLCLTPRIGPPAEHYVDERVGDASIDDEWGLDLLVLAAERADARTSVNCRAAKASEAGRAHRSKQRHAGGAG
jgi:hypothetical protein